MKHFFTMLVASAFLYVFLGCDASRGIVASRNAISEDKATAAYSKINTSSKPAAVDSLSRYSKYRAGAGETGKSAEIKTVVYVEVNDNNLRNAGTYVKESDKTPFFDIAIIFAANINYDSENRRAVFFANDNVQHTLENKAQYIEPLQEKGIKVLLSILGNHQGAGIANFPNREAARDFAQQLAHVVERYNLDGIDFDDEWSQYGTNGTGQPNAHSFIMLLQELRTLLPLDKIISFFNYGPAANYLEWNGKKAGDYLDYSYYSSYSWYANYFSVPGMSRQQLSASAVRFQNTPVRIATANAESTIRDGYGVYMMYDLPNADMMDYISAISQKLYGTSVTRETLYEKDY